MCIYHWFQKILKLFGTRWVKSFSIFQNYLRHHLAAPDAIAKVLKLINYTVELTWYSPRATHWTLEHGRRIRGFRFKPIWLCRIVEIFATWAKFLQPSSYCTVINCNFTFHTTIAFGSFLSGIIVQFEPLNA